MRHVLHDRKQLCWSSAVVAHHWMRHTATLLLFTARTACPVYVATGSGQICCIGLDVRCRTMFREGINCSLKYGTAPTDLRCPGTVLPEGSLHEVTAACPATA